MRSWRNSLSRALNVRALIAAAALFVTAGAALALTIPPAFSPRQFTTQQTHYVRFPVSFNSCVLAAGTCNVKVGAVPYNAWILRAYQQIVTSFNSGTTDTVAIGVTAGGAELVAAQSVAAAAGGATALTVVSANAGTVKTGDGATSTNTIGSGFDIWVKYTQTGAASTAGAAYYIIEYAAPNDGSCAVVPIGSTGIAC